ncbi:MAG TPA: dihydrolipoamide acetyltransferase family protein [Polyangiaceae bacterium]|nr:dihydrolipoamide acetyltransferase family protein [Polyangiaceae bacterium]
MARFEFKLPDIGEGVTEGEIVTWHAQVDQIIKEDDPMVEVMTDKATVTIAAPRTGRVVELRGEVGQVVQVHSVLVVLELEEGVRANGAHAESASENGAGKATRENVASAVGDIREDLPGMSLGSAKAAPAPAQATAGASGTYFNERPLATPATRKLARDLGLDLRTLRPTGQFGRVTTDDVRRASSGPALATAEVSERQPLRAVPDPRPATGGGGANVVSLSRVALEERTPLKGIRKRIFENMARSKQKAAHFTFVEECDVGALKALRQRLKPAAEAQGTKLTFLPFIVKAVVIALRRHPTLNQTFDEATQEIVTRRYYNIGIAASTDAGLVVPVVKSAAERSLLDIAREIERLAEDARKNRLKIEDVQGSTFTITSLGQQGGLFATPVINFPEVAILGVHQIKKKPVVRNDQIVIGEVMLLSLSFDHRLVDGHIGAAFAYELIRLLENPESMFLEMI